MQSLAPGAQAALDRLTRVAARVLRAPAALINRLDEEREICLSSYDPQGYYRAGSQSALEDSLCHHVALREEPLVVEDAREHPRTRDNRAVLAGRVGAYLGVPLATAQGRVIGTLCVLDGAPRAWTPEDVALLSDLAEGVVTELALREEVARREWAEEALRARTAFLEQLVDNAPAGVVVLDAQDRVVRTNPEFTRLFGFTAEELAGRVLGEFIVPGGIEEARALTRRVADGDRISVETVRQDRDGRPIDVLIQAVPVRLGGEQLGVFGIYQDLTERKRAEQAVRESEQRFRALFEHAAIGIALVGMDGRPVAANSALARMLGRSAAELCASTFAAITHPDDVEVDWELFHELIRGEREHYQIEKRYLRRDGSVLWGRLSASMIRAEDGSPLYAIGMVEDVSEHRRAEALAQEVRVLEGLLPICMFCKSIRNAEGEWERLEQYVASRSEADFSHGLCADCGREHYGDLFE